MLELSTRKGALFVVRLRVEGATVYKMLISRVVFLLTRKRKGGMMSVRPDDDVSSLQTGNGKGIELSCTGSARSPSQDALVA